MSDDVGTVENGGSSEFEKPRTAKVGRPPGSLSKKKLNLQKRILEHERFIFAKLLTLIKHGDGPTALAAIRLAWAYCYGKPPDRLLIGNDQGKPFVVATPEPVKTFEDWQQLVKEAEQIAADHAASS